MTGFPKWEPGFAPTRKTTSDSPIKNSRYEQYVQALNAAFPGVVNTTQTYVPTATGGSEGTFKVKASGDALSAEYVPQGGADTGGNMYGSPAASYVASHYTLLSLAALHCHPTPKTAYASASFGGLVMMQIVVASGADRSFASVRRNGVLSASYPTDSQPDTYCYVSDFIYFDFFQNKAFRSSPYSSPDTLEEWVF